jgi:uncharacterized protein YceK
MTVTKNVYVLMLALVIVLSGCFGVTTDESDAQNGGGQNSGDETQSNSQTIWYVNGIANHTCVAQEGAAETEGRQINPPPNNSTGYHYCIVDDDTMEDEWVRIQNYTIIHQDVDTGINVHSFATSINGGTIGTICNNGAIAGWHLTPDNGDSYDNSNTASVVEGLLPFAGLECDHYLFGTVYIDEPLEVYWHVAYEIISLNQGPHN